MRVLLAALVLASCAAAPPAAEPTRPVRLGSTNWQEDEAILALAVSPDGTVLAKGNAAGDVRLVDAVTGAVLLDFPQHDGAVRAVAFSPDGKFLASTGGSRHTLVSSVRDGRLGLDHGITGDSFYDFGSLAFSPDGRTLAVGGMDAGLHLLNLFPVERLNMVDGAVPATWDLATWGVCALEWSRDGKALTCGCGDGTVKVLDADTGKILRTYKDAKPDWLPRYRTVGLLDGGASVIAVRGDGLVDRWSLDGSGGKTLDEPEAKFSGGALSPRGDLLVIAARDGTLRRIDPATGKETGRAALSKRALLCAAFLPDGKSVACAGEDGAIRIVDAASGTVLRGPTGHLGPAYCVARSPDGRRVATGGRDGTARLWDVATGMETALLCSTAGPVYAVAFSADGRTVSAGGWDGFLRTFDAATGAPVGEPVDLGAEVRAIPSAVVTAGPWRILEDGTVGTMGR